MANVTRITTLGPGGVPIPAGFEIFVLGIPLRPEDPGFFVYAEITGSANSTVLTQEQT